MALLLLAACASTPTRPARPLDFTYWPAGRHGMTHGTAVALAGRIDVGGMVIAGCLGSSVSAQLHEPGEHELVFVIHTRWALQPCRPEREAFRYEAAVTDLVPGRWHVQVLHTSNSSLSPPNTVFHDWVDVY